MRQPPHDDAIGRTQPRTNHLGATYEIRVQGQLDPSWSESFEGLAIRATPRGETVLSGYIRDQTALYSILSRLYRLNLPLLSVNRLGPGETDGR